MGDEEAPDSKELQYAKQLLEDLSHRSVGKNDPSIVAAEAQAFALVAIADTLDLVLYQLSITS